MVGRPRDPEPVQVRTRTGDDLEACRTLALALLDRDGYPPRMPISMDRFVAAPGALGAWVAEFDSQVLGNVVLTGTSSPEVMALASAAVGEPEASLAVVARLMVDPAVRRRGTARALLRTARDAALAMERRPVLDVAAHFVAARALYEAEGWTCAGDVTVKVGDLEPLEEVVYVWGATAPDR